ncbi:MAG: universal stress protein [Solirubrobacteraceae bacterium]|nr:universal stress protein [Solirubrobacteraceae bacterium]
MARRRLHGLQRVLGVNALFSTAYGNVGSSIYYALGLVASYALGLTPIVFVISGVIFFLTAATYAEATTMFPEAGGSSSFARRAFNEFASFFAAWGQMLNYIITIAISAYFVPHYLGSIFWAPLRHGPADIIVGIVIVAILAAINIIGAQESTGVNVTLAVLDFATQLLLVVAGLVLVFNPEILVSNVRFGVAPEWSQFLLAIPIGMIAYTGIETISNMAEEAKDEARTVPKAINRVVIAVFAIYALLPAVALSALPVKQQADGSYQTLLGLPEDQGGFAGDPVLGVVKQLDLGALQGAAEVYVGLLAATILLIAANAGIIGVSRLVYSMGIHRQLPDGLRRLHPRFGTPWIGIIIFGAVACLAITTGQADFLGSIYAFGAMLSFTIAHAAVVKLRFSRPNAERPYRGPGNITVRGVSIPVFAVLGGLGTFTALIVVSVLNLSVLVAGLAWLTIGVCVYVLYRRSQGLGLLVEEKVQVPQPVVPDEAEYESVLVALEPRDYSPGAVATAVRMAAQRRHGVHVVVPITVPNALPIEAAMPEREAAAQAVIEQACMQGGSRVSGHWEKVRAGQAGNLIVREAQEIGAQAIVMAMPPRQAGSLFGKTLETVLERRPCRVIIQSDPGSPAGKSRRGETVA